MDKTINAVATGKKRANAVVQVGMVGDKMLFTVAGVGVIELNIPNIAPANRAKAELHGWKQRVSDAAAIPCNPDTGKPATPAEKFAAMSAIVEHYNSGSADWSIKRAEGGRDTGAIVVQALANLKGKSIEEMARQIGELAARSGVEPAAIIKRLAGNADVIREVAAIRAARVGVDADDLLSELE